jgi:hypothetical protein
MSHNIEPVPEVESSIRPRLVLDISPVSSHSDGVTLFSPTYGDLFLNVSTLRQRGHEFATTNGITAADDVRAFEIGAVLSALPNPSRAVEKTSTVTSQNSGSADTTTSIFSSPTTTAGVLPPRLFQELGLDTDETLRFEQEARGNAGTSFKDKWKWPFSLWFVVGLCSVCAAVQGMDETVVNGAQIFYSRQFGIGDENSSKDTWLVGSECLCPSATESC